MSASPVRDIVLVLDDEMRIPVDVRPTGETDEGSQTWEVLMEIQPDLIWPRVVKIEGFITVGHCLTVPCGPGYDTPEWGKRIFANSPDLTKYREGGYGGGGWTTR